jgi:hypothetical protein
MKMARSGLFLSEPAKIIKAAIFSKTMLKLLAAIRLLILVRK